MASERQIDVGGVRIGGGAPVAVQTMTKTETANVAATMEQIGKVVEAGADLVRVAVPRDKDAEALKTIVRESPIPVIADIHFNHTLALKAIDAGAHCIRLNPGNIGGREKVAEVAERATAAGVPMRIGVNSGSLPKHLHALERESPVEALVTAAVEFVELMESLDFEDFKVSIKSTNVPNTIAANRLLSERIPYPLHLGITEAGTKWSGSLKSAVGLGTLLADGIGDTIRISLSTFHAEEEGKVAWHGLQPLGPGRPLKRSVIQLIAWKALCSAAKLCDTFFIIFRSTGVPAAHSILAKRTVRSGSTFLSAVPCAMNTGAGCGAWPGEFFSISARQAGTVVGSTLRKAFFSGLASCNRFSICDSDWMQLSATFSKLASAPSSSTLSSGML